MQAADAAGRDSRSCGVGWTFLGHSGDTIWLGEALMRPSSRSEPQPLSSSRADQSRHWPSSTAPRAQATYHSLHMAPTLNRKCTDTLESLQHATPNWTCSCADWLPVATRAFRSKLAASFLRLGSSDHSSRIALDFHNLFQATLAKAL